MWETETYEVRSGGEVDHVCRHEYDGISSTILVMEDCAGTEAQSRIEICRAASNGGEVMERVLVKILAMETAKIFSVLIS